MNRMREILEEKLARFEELERQMMDPAIVSNSARVAAVAREHGSLAKLATKYRAFKRSLRRNRRTQADGQERRCRRAGHGQRGTPGRDRAARGALERPAGPDRGR